MKKMKQLSLALTSIGALTISGCTATKQAEANYSQERDNILTMSDASRSQIVAGGTSKTSTFNKVNRNYVVPTPLEKAPEARVLPALFDKKVTITMPGTVNAVEVLSELQRASAINFKLDKEVYDSKGGIASIIKDGGSGSGTTQAKTNFPVLVSDFVFQGTLSDALDLFTAKTALSWKWNGSFVEVFKFESISYKISALSGTIDSSSSVNLQGDTSTVTATADAGGGGGSSGGQAATSLQNNSKVSRNAKMALWDEIKTTVLSLMSADGTLAISEAMGTITVRDTPFAHQKIKTIVEDMNTNLTGQVYLNVDIYEVTLSDGDDLSIDWNMAWKTIGGKYNFGVSSLGGASSATSAVSFGIVNGNWAGTKAMVGALSSLGKASVLNSFTITTLSGQPAPIAVNRNLGYLKSMTRDKTPEGDTSYSLAPGNVSLGVNINVKPKILKGNQILLEYVMNLSDLERLRQITSPDETSMIEVPTTHSKSASQIATLKSGQTLIMSGFKQKSSTIENSGVGSSKNILLGGKQAGTVKDSYLIVTVTPYIAKTGTAK